MKLQVNEDVNTVIEDKAGRIVATCWRSPKKKKTIAKELVRRWNAFEDGGIVEELRTACEESQKAIMLLYECNKEVEIALGSGIQLKKAEELLKVALAKSQEA